MIARRTAWALGAATLLVIGARAADTAISLGQNLAGESCSLAAMPGSDAPQDIACGATADAGTAVVVPLPQALPANDAARQAAIVAGGQIRARIRRERLRRRTVAGQEPRALYLHRSQHKLAAHRHRGRSRPFALQRARPALVVSGPGNRRSQNVRRHGFAGQHGGVAGEVLARRPQRGRTADFGSWANIWSSRGALYSGADNYAQAEASYREALAIETRPFGRIPLLPARRSRNSRCR